MKLKDATITNQKIADGTIIASKIADANVTDAKIVTRSWNKLINIPRLVFEDLPYFDKSLLWIDPADPNTLEIYNLKPSYSAALLLLLEEMIRLVQISGLHYIVCLQNLCLNLDQQIVNGYIYCVPSPA